MLDRTRSAILNDFQPSTLDTAGRGYYEFRADLMVRNNEGLTKTYNRFHDPDERSADILSLRELHAVMDRAVLEAYGWHDLAQSAACDFLLDYEDEEDDEQESSTRRRRKPWRYRWPDDFRDEVLARLLALNAARAEQERLTGAAIDDAQVAAKKKATTDRTANRGRQRKPKLPTLLPLEREHRYLLMLLRQWQGRSVVRRVLNEAMILMLDDQLRAALLSRGKVIAGKNKNDTSINQVFTDLSIDGFIEPVGSEHQQLWRITATAPQTNDASPEDLKRVEEVMRFLNQEHEAGRVTITEETVDANVDLIPA